MEDFLKKIDEEKIRDQQDLDAQLNEQVRQKLEEMEQSQASLSRQSDDDIGKRPKPKPAAAKKKVKVQQSPVQESKKPQMVAKKALPSARKGQQDLLIENYQELNKKYADLHIKLNQLHQQVQSQKDIQVQVEATITKAIRTALPELVKKQVEETLPPIL